jgi:hypothetical protein
MYLNEDMHENIISVISGNDLFEIINFNRLVPGWGPVLGYCVHSDSI